MSKHVQNHRTMSPEPSSDGRQFKGLQKEPCYSPEWARKNSDGYRVVTNGKGGKSLGHRLAYRLFVGPIMEGMMVLHRCGNAACVNPHHLYLGNARQNADDRRLHGNTKTGGRLPQTKLTDAEVVAIRASNDSCIVLAKLYRVSRSYIWCIRAGKARAKKVEG